MKFVIGTSYSPYGELFIIDTENEQTILLTTNNLLQDPTIQLIQADNVLILDKLFTNPKVKQIRIKIDSRNNNDDKLLPLLPTFTFEKLAKTKVYNELRDTVVNNRNYRFTISSIQIYIVCEANLVVRTYYFRFPLFPSSMSILGHQTNELYNMFADIKAINEKLDILYTNKPLLELNLPICITSKQLNQIYKFKDIRNTLTRNDIIIAITGYIDILKKEERSKFVLTKNRSMSIIDNLILINKFGIFLNKEYPISTIEAADIINEFGLTDKVIADINKTKLQLT